MYAYEYYTAKDGGRPSRDWIAALPQNERAVIRAKIQKLSEEGLKLLKGKMLETIKGYYSDFYELKGGQIRIGVYLDRSKNMFILLHGWRKQKQKQTKDVAEAASRLRDYLTQ